MACSSSAKENSDCLYSELTEIDTDLALIDSQLVELKNQKRKLVEKKCRIQKSLSLRAKEASQPSASNWENDDFKWSKELRSCLENVFKIPAFRPLQLSTINAVLSGEDVLLIMSTGGGKSLCYQLPAVISKGFTLVISPLISLMEDQVSAMKQLNVDVAMLCQVTEKTEVTRIMNSMSDPSSKMSLLYVTPERLAKSKRFMAKLEKTFQAKRLGLIAIDEVHCCSQWGHDFRPDYKFLNILRRQFAGVPILGLTATATGGVIDDVKEMLGIPGSLTFRAGFNRPNLFYELRQKPSEQATFMDDLYLLLNERFKDQSGIIYCFSKRESDELAGNLRSRGIKAACYHADLESKHRSSVHTKWTANQCQVIVATVAFGMGIDKPDVRFVIHHSLPKSMENYYQESGRAGRDNLSAYCILYYRLADIFRQSTMVCTEKTGLENLYSMLSYCINCDTCRRAIIARHFGENWEPDWCDKKCDICKRNGASCEETNVSKYCTELAKILRAASASANQRLTGLKIIDSLIKALGGKRSIDRTLTERILANLLLESYIKEDFHFTPYSIISYIVPGPRFDQITNGVTVRIPGNHSEPAKKKKKVEIVTL